MLEQRASSRSRSHTRIRVEWSKSQGTSVDWVNLEPSGLSAVSSSAPKLTHPDAGKLFINSVLSQVPEKSIAELSSGVTSTAMVLIPILPDLIKGFQRIRAASGGASAKTRRMPEKLHREIFGLPIVRAIHQKEEGVISAHRGLLRVMQILFLWRLGLFLGP